MLIMDQELELYSFITTPVEILPRASFYCMSTMDLSLTFLRWNSIGYIFAYREIELHCAIVILEHYRIPYTFHSYLATV